MHSIGQVAQARKKESKIQRTGFRGKDRPGLFDDVPRLVEHLSPFPSYCSSPYAVAILFNSRGRFAVQPQKSKGIIPAGSPILSPLPSSLAKAGTKQITECSMLPRLRSQCIGFMQKWRPFMTAPWSLNKLTIQIRTFSSTLGLFDSKCRDQKRRQVALNQPPPTSPPHR